MVALPKVLWFRCGGDVWAGRTQRQKSSQWRDPNEPTVTFPKYKCWRCSHEWEGWSFDGKGERTGPTCPNCGNRYLTWLNYEAMRRVNFT